VVRQDDSEAAVVRRVEGELGLLAADVYSNDGRVLRARYSDLRSVKRAVSA
jgi:hypothetical protein